jgi:hypothetical protein
VHNLKSCLTFSFLKLPTYKKIRIIFVVLRRQAKIDGFFTSTKLLAMQETEHTIANVKKWLFTIKSSHLLGTENAIILIWRRQTSSHNINNN